MTTEMLALPSRTRLLLTGMLVVMLAGSASGQLSILKANPQIVEQRRQTLAPHTQRDRLRVLREQFVKAKTYAVGPVEEQSVPGQKEPNLICAIPGTEGSTIVVTANTDYKNEEDRVQAKWSTLMMLPLLAESLGPVASRHTIVFVAVTGGRSSHSGAAWYIHQLTKEQRKRVQAVIELSDIGNSPVVYAPNRAGRKLGRPLVAVASGLNLDLSVYAENGLPGSTFATGLGAVEERTGPISTDFQAANVAAITIRSWEGPVNPSAYYETYLLLGMYIRQLDRDLERTPLR